MVIKVLKNISKLLGFGTALLYTGFCLSGEMPTGASVQSGDVSISGTNTDHLIIDQSQISQL